MDKPATRIVALYGAFNDILFELGAGDLLVARTNADARDPRLADLPSIGSHMRPSLESIIEAKPDLVLQMTGRKESGEMVEAARSLGIPALSFALDSFENLFAATLKIGALAGKADEAAKLVASWRERLANIRKQDDAPVRTFFEIRYPDLICAGGQGIVNDIIEAAGGENIIKLPKKMVRLNEEIVVSADPESYIYQQGPMNPSPEPPESREAWQSIRALREGDVLRVDERLFSRPGPGSVTAAENLASFFARIRNKRDMK